MLNKDTSLFGTKIYNYKTKELGLLIYTWTNVYADGNVDFATCVDFNGKKYSTELDNLKPYEDATDDERNEWVSIATKKYL